ncbi:hypothetical protein FEM48_Zijuj03G0156300 [Ziziphus jujuba var. spinosa]|uniref:SLH domain-containing protein n=1 Tax=Ziziphus jujuba var. spinosa TaxID=714518 RepID=A0A978VR57_ZIZJJ|nr:hypothetical protein FEM48_Zijuj03G0156300 [Ziziphus jujuba var. spinosa]
MAAMAATTCLPSSPQLRLALNGVNYRKSPAILVRPRMGKQDRWIRALCLANEEARNASGKRCRRIALVRADSGVDGFSGWSGSEGGEESMESERKNWFGGIVGAGVAGVVLAGGLTFAALSLGKRSSSRSKQQMEPLTTQQEVSLVSDDRNDEVLGLEKDLYKQDDGSLEGGTGTHRDSSSSSEIIDASKNRVGDESDVGSMNDHESDGTDVFNNASTEETVQYKSTFNEKSDDTDSDTVSKSYNLLEHEKGNESFVASGFEDLDGNFPLGTAELTSEQENPVIVRQADLSVSNTVPSNLSLDKQDELSGSSGDQTSDHSLDSTSFINHSPNEPLALNESLGLQSNSNLEPHLLPKDSKVNVVSSSSNPNVDLSKLPEVLAERSSPLEVHSRGEGGPSGTSVSASELSFPNQPFTQSNNDISKSTFVSSKPGNSFSSAGIPAPSVVSAALQVLPGKVLVPAVVDQVQGQALAALQVLKVIEADVQPGDLCTRREFARWLVSASSALSRNTISKVYPAMYIENVTELAFDDVTPGDPDFSSIQGLAEAGLISSKLSRHDMLLSLDEDQGPVDFSPESPLSRQDLVSWKMALEKRQLPEADRKVLYRLSGFIDSDKVHPDACPALVADLSAGEQGIIALAFGYTRLFQPHKPVTKAQAAIALAIGEASDVVNEELARIEAESMAENAVSAHSALVAEVEKDVNANFEKELSKEREKIDAIEKMAEEARTELEKLRAEREEDNIALMKERAAVDSEMEVLSRLRREVEEQLQSLMSNKVEISYEKEKINKLRKETENESQEIARLQYELEVERKALSMARAWAEDEAKRAREQAKALEEARDRWERHGIKVVVDNDLREESLAGVTWLDAGKQVSVEGTVSRAENLMGKLKAMAEDVREKSRDIIYRIIQKIALLISKLKEWASEAGRRTENLRHAAVSKAYASAQELQQSTSEFRLTIREGAKRVMGDCREGVEKLTQKFKT